MYAISSTQMLTAKANPNAFKDGIVIERGFGFVTLKLFSGESIKLRLFESPADSQFFSLFEPVAFHPDAEVIAAGNNWMSVTLLENVLSN